MLKITEVRRSDSRVAGERELSGRGDVFGENCVSNTMYVLNGHLGFFFFCDHFADLKYNLSSILKC